MKVFSLTSLPFFILLLAAVSYWVYATKKLTATATFTAALLAVCIYCGTGISGISLLGAFFFLGTGATAWQKRTKQAMQLAEVAVPRNAGQVLANGGMAGILAIIAAVQPQHKEAMLLLMGGAFSAAAADTCSSELGMLYGKRFYNIRTLWPEQRGLDGVVSIEGTAAGIAASLVIAIVYYIGSNNAAAIIPIIVAGTAGNIADSFLGATMERKGILKNDGVNLLNTAVGAAVMLLWFEA